MRWEMEDGSWKTEVGRNKKRALKPFFY